MLNDLILLILVVVLVPLAAVLFYACSARPKEPSGRFVTFASVKVTARFFPPSS